MFANSTKRLALKFRAVGRENMDSLVNEVRLKMATGVSPPW